MALLDALNLGVVHLIGIPMWGFAVTKPAGRDSARSRTVTLVDGGLPINSGEQRPPPVEALAARTHAQDAAEVLADEAAYLSHYRAGVSTLISTGDPRKGNAGRARSRSRRDGVSVKRDLDTVVDALSAVAGDAPAHALPAV